MFSKKLLALTFSTVVVLAVAHTGFYKKQNIVVTGQIYKINNFSKNGNNLELLSETSKYKVTCTVRYDFFKDVHHFKDLQRISYLTGFSALTSEAQGTVQLKDSRSIASDSTSVPAIILKNEKEQYFCSLRV